MTEGLALAPNSDLDGEPQRRKWKRYPAYRDSGVEWLGEIPNDWSLTRLRFICNVNPRGVDSAVLNPGLVVSFLPMDHIREDGRLSLDETRTAGRVSNGYTCFQDQDVILAKITPCFENGKGALCDGLVNGVGFGTTELHVLRAYPIVEPRFVMYLIRSHPFRGLGQAAMLGSAGQQRVPEEFVKDFQVALPSISEQLPIICHLDRETKRIDALVAKKERLIELLLEKRAALIDRVVTKGLDSAVPMKDSGVEWLGEIPGHWKVMRLKYAARLESGHTPNRLTPEYWVDCTIPWVTLNDVGYLKDHDYVHETANHINELGLAGSSARVLPTGTVVLSRDATVGRCGILGRPMATSQHFVDWICGKDLVPEYLLQVFRGPMQQELQRLTMGATLRTIGMSDVNSFCAPLPPVEEQHSIVAHLDRETTRIDALIAKVREAIEKLKEYRTALISAAVTGKIDVRGETGHYVVNVMAST